jgi:hypothetical protein
MKLFLSIPNNRLLPDVVKKKTTMARFGGGWMDRLSYRRSITTIPVRAYK